MYVYIYICMKKSIYIYTYYTYINIHYFIYIYIYISTNHGVPPPKRAKRSHSNKISLSKLHPPSSKNPSNLAAWYNFISAVTAKPRSSAPTTSEAATFGRSFEPRWILLDYPYLKLTASLPPRKNRAKKPNKRKWSSSSNKHWFSELFECSF